jgi:hypothetical protein
VGVLAWPYPSDGVQLIKAGAGASDSLAFAVLPGLSLFCMAHGWARLGLMGLEHAYDK